MADKLTPGKSVDTLTTKVANSFIQKKGPRKGQHFLIKRGKSGKSERVYDSGDTADTAETRKRKFDSIG